MVSRHYPHPHRFVCITDDTTGLYGVETIPLWSDYADVPAPSGPRNPSCYRRLKLFDPAIESLLGPRFVAMDLDCVVIGDLTPIFHRPEDFVIWGDTNPKTFYNGSLQLHTAGARAKVWTEFDPVKSPFAAKAAGHFGSDQGWISYCLGPGEARWNCADGVYSYRNHIRATGIVPTDARIVICHGALDPWVPAAAKMPWVQEHYK